MLPLSVVAVISPFRQRLRLMVVVVSEDLVLQCEQSFPSTVGNELDSLEMQRLGLA